MDEHEDYFSSLYYIFIFLFSIFVLCHTLGHSKYFLFLGSAREQKYWKMR